VGATLDVESYSQFAPVLQWTPKGRCEITIDCAALKLISTAGLGLFLLVDAHARKHFGHAKIINCNDDVARVLQTATDFTARFRMPFERAAKK
jgi:anti-anti-sigma regulatory factor